MTTKGEWIPVEPRVIDAGDIGGDGQLTAAWSVRYHHRTLPGALVDVAFYGDDIGAPSCTTGVSRIRRQTELMLCRDLKDPGGTEEWSDYLYAFAEAEEVTYPDALVAEARAKELAEAHTADMVTWNGLPDWATADA